MKHFKLIVATLFIAILAACGGQAKAQALPYLFKSAAGMPFSIDQARSIYYTTGKLNIVYDNGKTLVIVDGTGATYQAIIASPYVLSKFTQVGTAARYVQLSHLVNVTCKVYGGLQYTSLEWDLNSSVLDDIGDNCAFFYTISAASN